MEIFGKHFNCLNELVVLNSDNTISFPNSYSRQNCIGKIFNEFGREEISFLYNERIDRVDVHLPMGLLKMNHCQ